MPRVEQLYHPQQAGNDNRVKEQIPNKLSQEGQPKIYIALQSFRNSREIHTKFLTPAYPLQESIWIENNNKTLTTASPELEILTPSDRLTGNVAVTPSIRTSPPPSKEYTVSPNSNVTSRVKATRAVGFLFMFLAITWNEGRSGDGRQSLTRVYSQSPWKSYLPLSKVM